MCRTDVRQRRAAPAARAMLTPPRTSALLAGTDHRLSRHGANPQNPAALARNHDLCDARGAHGQSCAEQFRVSPPAHSAKSALPPPLPQPRASVWPSALSKTRPLARPPTTRQSLSAWVRGRACSRRLPPASSPAVRMYMLAHAGGARHIHSRPRLLFEQQCHKAQSPRAQVCPRRRRRLLSPAPL